MNGSGLLMQDSLAGRGRQQKKRGVHLLVMLLAWGVVVMVHLVRLQIVDHERYRREIQRQTERIRQAESRRGTIRDQGGEVLAISVAAKSVGISAQNRQAGLELLNRISGVLDLGTGELRAIRRRLMRGDGFVWVKRKIALREAELLASMNNEVKGASLALDDDYRRIYPQGRSACHVLGGVGIDEQGLCGVEYALDKAVRGRGYQVRTLSDARHRVFDMTYLQEPQKGEDVSLTLDLSIQHVVETALARTVKAYSARGGSVVVMDVRTGAILALANVPDYHPADLSGTPAWKLKNRAVSFLYDPGSTFKVLVGAAALEHNVCTPQQVFDCHNGVMMVADRRIVDVHPFHELSFENVLIQSSNVGAASIGMRLGRERFYGMVRQMGFGRRVGLALTGEEAGLVNPPERWSEVSLAFMSYGYELLVTPMQMARAYNVIASGGYLMHPYLVSGVGGERTVCPQPRRVLSKSVCDRMAAIMTEVVRQGTGQQCRIPGMDVAGKTGTAKKVVGGRYQKVYVSSFGGFFPAQNPRITMFVVIDEPSGKYYGGDVAAPLFREITEKLLIYLRLFPDLDLHNEVRL